MFRFLITVFSIVVVFVSSAFLVDRSGRGELAIAEDLAFAPYSKTFTITAYYSPLPCQDRYATGSYDGDIRLNGNGTNGADGTQVYPGMVAAPKVYAFGTKMNVPGIGIVAVHDRGGAIVASSGENGVYDRLDVWMGFGDVGLKRALGWGKRTVDVTVYGVTDAVDENMTLMGFDSNESVPKSCVAPVVIETDFDNEAPTEAPEKVSEEVSVLPVVPVVPKVEQVVKTFLDKDLRLGDSGNEVAELQNRLKKLNLFRGEVTSFYGEVTAHAVFKFQQINGLVMDESSQYAGVFGAKTRSKMNAVTASKLYVEKMLVKADVPVTKSFVPLSFGMTGKAVTDLQLFLRDQGFFGGAFLTEYFGSVTKEAVIKFQLSQGIIASSDDVSAGVVGPATLEAIGKLAK